MSTGFSDADREFFERELDSFLPDRIYDAHAHIWEKEWANFTLGSEPVADLAAYRRAIAEIHGDRRTETLFLSFAVAEARDQISAANAWTAAQIADHPACRAHFFVTPQDDPEWVRDEVKRLGMHGLKCYHTFADVDPTWDASIPDYLPEPLVAVAGDEAWTITLHMVKARAVADPDNQHWIRHYCETFPKMQLILAHSARGFQPGHNMEGLESLVGLDNLWFDTAANCEPIAHQSIIRLFGHDRLMYGSDLPVSHLRGRSLGAGDNFLWLYEETPVWGEKHVKVQPVMVGLEHLRSVKWACWSEKLTDSQIEDVFWNNAARLFNVTCNRQPHLVGIERRHKEDHRQSSNRCDQGGAE
ncbi:MAG: amidohydrolase family protein [Candidatus Latescibacterota bacterium]|nr:amidohydrolase family protein [Candidatus Latescibacterota bacterium]